MKKAGKIAAAVLGVLAVGAACWYIYTPAPEKLEKYPKSVYTTDYIYNTSSDRETAGISDYVFVGTRSSFDGYTYKDIMPSTEYHVNVLQNMKGELPTDTPVSLGIEGGLDRLKLSAMVPREGYDVLEEGKQYVIITNVDAAGKLVVNAPNKVIPADDAVIAQYQDAIANQVQNETVQASWDIRNHVYGEAKT